jgi:hypothetical protein
MRLLAPVLLLVVLLAIAAPASARVKPGLYKGKTSDGLPVKVRVTGNRVLASAKVHVDCTFRSGEDPTGTPRRYHYDEVVSTPGREDGLTKLKGSGFAFSEDYIESGTAGTDATASIDGTFSGSRVTGDVDFDEGGTSQLSGSTEACAGSAFYSARRVPGS